MTATASPPLPRGRPLPSKGGVTPDLALRCYQTPLLRDGFALPSLRGKGAGGLGSPTASGAIAANHTSRYDCPMKSGELPTSRSELITIIRDAIASAGGQIPFARYMALALYEPVHGYYASGRGAPGREGADFLT